MRVEETGSERGRERGETGERARSAWERETLTYIWIQNSFVCSFKTAKNRFKSNKPDLPLLA